MTRSRSRTRSRSSSRTCEGSSKPVGKLASSIRSAARATYSAYKRQPIRWRLAGGSAALTLVILCGFAVIVGTLTTRAIYSNFNRETSSTADRLASQLTYVFAGYARKAPHDPQYNCPHCPTLDDVASAYNAAIRVATPTNYQLTASHGAPDFGAPAIGSQDIKGWRVEARRVETFAGTGPPVAFAVQYARRVSTVEATANRVKLFLALGVLGGAALALLAGLATARRAREPITELTAAARDVARTRDTSTPIPRPEADDEVAELAETLETMLHALDEARGDTEAALARQREFVADASHELRTPLTSVLANLELLEETLKGEARDTAASALRSSRRMRRLVADLLLLARADAGREIQHRAVDLSDVVTDAASELEPVAGDHEISV